MRQAAQGMNLVSKQLARSQGRHNGVGREAYVSAETLESGQATRLFAILFDMANRRGAVSPQESGHGTRAKQLVRPQAFVETRGGKVYAVYPHLRQAKLLGPEERVRMTVYNELIDTYRYPVRRLVIEHPVKIRDDEQPRFADIVVFDDDALKRPHIVVECKRPMREEGERQGQRYATILRSVYVLWTNGSARSASVLVNRYPEEAVGIDDIPPFGGKVSYEISTLKPFSDDRHMASVVKRCHDLIRANSSKKKASDAFDQFLRVLFVKFIDETAMTSSYEFQVFLRGEPPSPEDPNETAQRLRAMFHDAVTNDAQLATVFSEHDDIELPNDCLVELTKAIQGYSFSATDVDQKARAFESFLSGDMRQEFKEFLTPLRVVRAMVEIAQPKQGDAILDPSCGSAAFLVASLDYMRSRVRSKILSVQQSVKATFDFAHDQLWGIDISLQMANVARLNMLMNDDGRAHIFKHDSLETLSDAPPPLRGRQFDLILTNPPFGGKKTGSQLKTFGIPSLSSPGRGHLTEILFLERNIEWLKPGGRMIIVLPDSVLGNSTLESERKFIEQRARLVATVSLPADTFGPSGAKSKTSFVVLEKLAEGDTDFTDHDVFIAEIQHIGYDFTGRPTKEANQLPEVIDAFLEWEDGEEPESPLATVVPRSKLGDSWLATGRLRTGVRSNGSTQKPSQDFWRLGDLCGAAGIDTGKTAAHAAYADSGVHMVKVGNLSGKGIQWGSVERQYVDAGWAARAKKGTATLRNFDILFTAAAHGPKWLGLKVDIFTGVPPLFGEEAIPSGEVMRVRLRPDCGVDPYYIFLFLRSDAGYAEIQRCRRGQSGHLYAEQLVDIRIPKGYVRDRRVQTAVQAFKNVQALNEQARVALKTCDDLIADTIPAAKRKPVIAS